MDDREIALMAARIVAQATGVPAMEPEARKRHKVTSRGGRLGKRAQKVYAGTMKAAPADATVGSRVQRGAAVKIVESSFGQWDRMALLPVERPR